MNFNSFEFLVFLPVVLLFYRIIPYRFRWILLLAASYYFYMSWNAKFIFLIIATTLVSYLAGLALEKTRKERVKKLILTVTVIICIGALVFFKYFDFLAANVIAFLNLFSIKLDSFSLNLILPVGISFYTFQTLSYVIDVYRGKFRAEKHLGYYALFVCFFPQLVAGPIERPGDLIPQLKQEHKWNTDDFLCGLRILLTGFFYKVAVADPVGIYVNNAFANDSRANGLSVLLAGFLFTVQIYCDFAGYSEIAAGSARMMGIRITKNFNRPYLATGGSDFFRRWHITLTRWFTDYVYIPLGGNRKGLFRQILNTFIVFALCGLWHGADWTFVCWGLYAAVMLTVEGILKRVFRHVRKERSEKAVIIIIVNLLVIPGSIIFRSGSLSQAGHMLATLFTGWHFGGDYISGTLANLGADGFTLLGIAILTVSEIMLYRYAEIGRDTGAETLVAGYDDNRAVKRTIIGVYVVIIVALCWLALLSSGNSGTFAYFQF